MKNVAYKARHLSLFAHKGQMYGEHEYEYHLNVVANIGLEFFDEKIHQFAREEIEAVCWLHDIVEDTEIELGFIGKHFTYNITRAVYLCTDEDGKNRKERKTKTHAKLEVLDESRTSDALGLYVKSCDRLGNLRQCKIEKNTRKQKMYREEHEAFKQAVYREGLNENLFQEMDYLLNLQL